MKASDVVQLRGAYEWALRNANTGEIIDGGVVNNVVVTAGRRWVLQQLQSTDHATAQNLSHIAVGTSTTAPATSDTGLGSENTRVAINSFTTSNLTSNPPSFRAEVSFNTNQANTTLGEFGVFNSSSGGTMLSRITFSTVNKSTSNTFAISYTLSA
jgi:hypothetical protein